VVECPSCRRENADSARFCVACGKALVLACAECGADVPAGATFCPSCGAPVAVEAKPSGDERKVVTVIFADLVDSTSRAERLDPEDVRGLLSPYFTSVRAEVERFGGTIEKFIGDAVVAIFGAPVAHEDDPERAVRAAFAMREAVAGLSDGAEEVDLHLRIGVNTGEAVVALGAIETGVGIVTGDVVNTCQRLEAAAPVDGILVGESTYRATAGAFEYRDAGPVPAKGKSRPVPAWEAVSTREAVERPATPLVGRWQELSQLLDALVRVREERTPQLVSLVGVPGIGKTRLARELVNAVEAEPDTATWLRGRCLPYGDGVSFAALAEMARAQAGILTTDSEAEAAAKLRAAVEALPGEADAGWLETHLRPLVGLAAEAPEAREDSFAAWRRFFEALAEARPLVLVFEDLHWADPGVLDFVDHLVDWASGVPLLVLCTARPELLERRPDWGGGKLNAITISLSPLSDEETGDLVGAVLGQEPPAAVAEALLARAGGNPLYAEEYARMLLERGFLVRAETGWRLARRDLPLPESVQGTIAARIDTLPAEEKAVLQEAAVVGKVFWLGALASGSGLGREHAERVLHALERKEFVRRDRRSSIADEVEFAFRHVLVRDVAYGQLPRPRRAEAHERAAIWLESLGGEELAEQLAYHYECALELRQALGEETADLAGRAVETFHQAGERALSVNAFEAARRFFAAELDLRLEKDPRRPYALLGLGKALSHAEGSGTAELEQAYEALEAAGDREAAAEVASALGPLLWSRGDAEQATEWLNRAGELVTDLPPTRTKGLVLARLASLHNVRDETDDAQRLAQAALELAEQVGSDEVRARALGAIAASRTQTGDWQGFDDYAESVELATKLRSPEAIVNIINYAGARLAFGDLRGAFELQAQGRELARELGDRRYAAWLHAEQIWEHHWQGRWDEALRLADEVIESGGATGYMEIPARLTRARILSDRERGTDAANDVELALAQALEIGEVQVVVPALGLRARLGRERDPATAEADIAAALERIRGREVWAGLAWADVGVVLAELGLPFPDVAASSRWIEAARSLGRDPAGAAELYREIGSEPDEADARLRAAQLLLAADRSEEGAPHLKAALDFYRSVDATTRIASAETLLTSA
jgi:class 3 adenylate cyclase